MTSEKPQKNKRKVSAEKTSEGSSPPLIKGKEVRRTQEATEFENVDSLKDTIHKADHTSKSIRQSQSVDLIGTQLGDFKILRKLGQGGMATVYLAEQVSLKREAAIKVMHNELLNDETHLKRFEREAKAAAGLTHPNIVQVYMTGEFNGTHYIAQEYVRGINLREHLSRFVPPDCALILRIMRQVTAALNAAAEKGIVHRDIKPENIMITSKKQIKVADFGLAQIAQSDERVELTQVGTTMGTPLYMSPEQVNGKSLDQRSDIYSLGVTCYHLISGRPPFHGETALSIAVKHLNESPAPLDKIRPDLPQELCDLVHRMMEKDPNQRPADAKELMQEIKKIPEQASANDQRTWKSLVPFQSDQLFQKQLVSFLLISLCLGGVAAAVGWVNRPGDPLNAPYVESENEGSRGIPIPQEKTAMAQFLQAVKLKDDEDAWKAVITNFPGDLVFKPRAQIRLGILLIRPGRYEESKKIFQELVDSGQSELMVNGYAGLMALESLEGDPSDSQNIWKLHVLTTMNDPNTASDLDQELQEIVYRALVRNQKNPKISNEKVIKELFESFEDAEDDNTFEQ